MKIALVGQAKSQAEDARIKLATGNAVFMLSIWTNNSVHMIMEECTRFAAAFRLQKQIQMRTQIRLSQSKGNNN